MIKKLGTYLKGYGRESVLGPLFKLLEALFELFVPLVVAKMIDQGIRGGEGEAYVWKMGGLLLLLLPGQQGLKLVPVANPLLRGDHMAILTWNGTALPPRENPA